MGWVAELVAQLGPVQRFSLAFVVVAVVASLAYRSYFTIRYDPKLPRIGVDAGVKWKDMRAKFHSDCLAVFGEIYDNVGATPTLSLSLQPSPLTYTPALTYTPVLDARPVGLGLANARQYSKKGKAVLMPVFGPHDEVILPPTALAWLTRQPDHVMSSLEAQVDAIQLHQSLGHKFAYDPWGGMLIKSDLNAAIETVCAVLNDELTAAFDSCFGNDTEEFKEVDLFPACRVIGGRATLRFTLGDSEEGRKLCTYMPCITP